MASLSGSNQLTTTTTTNKTMTGKSLVGPEATTLAAFSKQGNLLVSPRTKNQLKDVESSASTARTSCASSSHDDRSDCGIDLHWEESSTSSSSDQELDGWASPSQVPAETSAKPTAAWSEPRDIPNSHKFHHASMPISSTESASRNSWAAPSGAARRPSADSATPPQRSFFQQPHQQSTPPAMLHQFHAMHLHQPRFQANPKDVFVGSPLHLSPVHLAALASSPHTASGPFAPRLRPVVRPINIGPPNEYDFRNTNGLMKCLNSLAQLPTPEELSAKHLVINELQRIVDEWMRATFPEEKDGTATLLLGGSWHLKVGLFDSDLDIVALLPNFVTSEVFFSSLHEHLQSLPSVTKLVAMSKATVPILAFQLNSVRIDLLFARFTQNVVPKNLPIHSDRILAGMDATSIRSLSVPRVSSLILELVPNDGAFRACLRIVRLWATRRGLYSNKAGFLGGVSWTILVAFICQMFPRATISSLIHRFFSVLSTWNWPTPILLSKPYECEGVDSSLQWCPQKNHHDRSHVMPIITPGFPAVNSAVNVNASTLRIMKEEFERGKLIMDDMLSKGLSSPAVWHKLFAPSEVLVRYDHYVVVELKATVDDDLTEWSNYVASRTRKLVESLQHTSPIMDVHPFPVLVKPHATPASEQTPSHQHTGFYFVGFTLQPPQQSHRRGSTSPQPKLEETMKSSVASAMRYFVATELDKCPQRRDGMDVEITYSKWQDLPESVFPNGRSAAAGERARHILSHAHTSHISKALGR